MGKQRRKGQTRTANHPHHKTGQGHHSHHQLYSGSHSNHNSSSVSSSVESLQDGNSTANDSNLNNADSAGQQQPDAATVGSSSVMEQVLNGSHSQNGDPESGRLTHDNDDGLGGETAAAATDPLLAPAPAAAASKEQQRASLQWTPSYVDDQTNRIRAMIEAEEERSSQFFEQQQQQQQQQDGTQQEKKNPAMEPLLNGSNETNNDQIENGHGPTQQQHSPSSLSTNESPTTASQRLHPLVSSLLRGCQRCWATVSGADGGCNSSFPGAVVNLCSATLGAGVLSVPHACAQAGLVASALLLVASAAATVWSIRLLVRACTFYQLYTYESLTEVLYGRRLRTAVEACIVVFCQGCAVAYLIAVADILQQAHLLLGNSRALTMTLIWACVLLPLSLLRTMSALQMSSAVGIASIGTLVFAAVVHWWDDEKALYNHDNDDNGGGGDGNETVPNATLWMPLWDNHTDGGNSTHSHDNADVDWSFMLWPQNGAISLLTACPIFLFAFSCQVNVCAIYEELPPPPTAAVAADATQSLQQQQSESAAVQSSNNKESLMRRVAAAAVAICALLYGGISLATLADFGADGVTPNILNAYPHPLRGIMQVAAAGVVLAVTMAFPLNIFPARVTLDGIWQEQDGGGGGCCGGCSWQRQSPPNDTESRGSNTSQQQQQQQQTNAAANRTGCCSFWKCCRRDGRTRRGRSSRGNPALTAALLEEELSRLEDELNRVHLEAQEASGMLREEDCESELDDSVHDDGDDNDDDDGAGFAWFRHILLTLALAGSALGIAVVAPDISVVFQLVGGTASSGLGFCVPGLLGLKLGRDLQDGTNGAVTCVSWLLLYGGAVIGVLTTAVTIYQIVTGR